MATRIRRSRPSPASAQRQTRIAELMKSISEKQIETARLAVQLKAETAELYGALKAAGVTHYETPEALADLLTPVGRAINIIDPAGFRKLVKNDKDFYSAITVSVTAAKKIVPEKQLAPITTTKEAKAGEETVRVVARGS